MVLKASKAIIIILVFAFLVRFVAIGQSLWLDEAIGALVVKERGFWDIAINFPKGDNHPPLYYMVLDIWSNLFGYSVIALRSLSVFFSIASIYISYLIANEILKLPDLKQNRSFSDSKFPLVTAMILATSPFYIYYAQEARMYMMASFLATLLVYSFMKVCINGNKKYSYIWWTVFSLSTTALVFTDYVPVFLLPVFPLYALAVMKKWSWWIRFVVSYTPTFLLGLWWLPTLMYQSGKGKWLMDTLPAWQKLAGGATVKQAALVWIKFVIGRVSFYDKAFYYTIVIVVSLPFIYLLYKAIRHYKETLLIWLWLTVPLTVGFVVSFFFPAFVYFRFVYIFPAFALIISYALVSLKIENIKIVFLSALLLINSAFTSLYLFNKNHQREDWKGAIAFVEASCNSGNDCVAVFTNPEAFAPARYYTKGLVEMSGSTDSISANKNETITKTKNVLLGKDNVYYFEYLQDLHDPKGYVLSEIEKNFQLRSIADFKGVGFVTRFVKRN